MTRLLVVLGLLVSASVSVSAEPVGVPLKDSVPHMTTTGEASVDVVPDEAELTLAVSEEKASADEATASAAKTATSIIDAIKAHGIAPADIRTRFFLTETFVDTKNEHGVVTGHVHRGYRATEHVEVMLHDITKVGPLARELIDKGANFFEGVRFIYSKERSQRRGLQVQAIRDAYQTAKNNAEALGLKLGRALQVGDDIDESGRQFFRFSGGATFEADTPIKNIPIEPGLQHLQATVSVVWEIESAAR